MTDSISIIMPAYNEEQSIASMLERILALNIANEIIVIDDGSSDTTGDIISQFADRNVILKTHPYNIGNGASIKTGLRTATGNIVVMLDADGQHPPEEIPRLLAEMDEYDMVVGARSKGSVSMIHRDIANRVFNIYASYLIGYNIPDLTSGFRAVRRKVAKQFIYLLPNGYSYPTTLTVSFFRSGFAVQYIPFESPARKGTSKINPLRDGLRFLLILTRLGVFFTPLKIFLPIGSTFVLIGGTYILYRLMTASRFSGLGGLLITIGFIAFMLGLIAEQIATMKYRDSALD